MQLLTETEAALLLSINPRTLANWRYRRQGPAYVRVGGAVRYAERDLHTWIEHHEPTTTQRKMALPIQNFRPHMDGRNRLGGHPTKSQSSAGR